MLPSTLFSSRCSDLSTPGCQFQEVEKGKYSADQEEVWFWYSQVVESRMASVAWHVEDIVDIFL